jgi:hypothetical protein
MDGKCLCCNDKEIKYIKRALCENCYRTLYHRGELHYYPLDENRLTLTHYPQEMINDFKSLTPDSATNLTRLSEKYGFTRERARQLYEKINGFKFTAIKNVRVAKAAERRSQLSILKRDPRHKVASYKEGSGIYRGSLAEKKVLDICNALGYEVRPFMDGLTIDLIVNGHNVEIKSSYKASFMSEGSRTPYYRFRLGEGQRIADFVVCYAAPANNFFVIPNSEWPRGESLYIPTKNRREWDLKNHHFDITNKYYAYLEAWHLLAPRKDAVFCNGSNVAQAAAM